MRTRTATRSRSSADPGAAALARIRSICLDYAQTSEADSWGHPNFRAGKKTFVTFEIIGGRPSIAFRLAPDQVSQLLQMRGFFATPYGRGLWVSTWTDGRLSWRLVERLVDDSYRQVATPRMLAALDQSA